MRVFVAFTALATVANAMRTVTDEVWGTRLGAAVSGVYHAQLIYLYGPEPAARLAVLPPALVLQAMMLLWLCALYPLVQALQGGPSSSRSPLAQYTGATARLILILLTSGAVVHVSALLELHRAPSAATLLLLAAPLWLAPFYVSVGWAARIAGRSSGRSGVLALFITFGFLLARSSAESWWWPTAHAATMLCGVSRELLGALLVILGWTSLIVMLGLAGPRIADRARRSRSLLTPTKLEV